jgi:hypothetical protein
MAALRAAKKNSTEENGFGFYNNKGSKLEGL